MKIGIVSGYWGPAHFGHIEYINESKKYCDWLIAIVNNDKQVKLKGSIPFMDEQHRCKFINSIKNINEVRLSEDTDKTVCKTIELIRKEFPNNDVTFFNSGDRVGINIETSEKVLCEKLGIEFKLLLLPKIYSSSQLIESAAEEIFKRKNYL